MPLEAITRFFRGEPDNDSTIAPNRAIVPYSDDPEERRKWLASLSLDELATMVRAATNARVLVEAELDRVQRLYDERKADEDDAKQSFRQECVRRNLA